MAIQDFGSLMRDFVLEEEALLKDWENIDPRHVDFIRLGQPRKNEWGIYIAYWVHRWHRTISLICKGKDEVDIRKKADEIAKRFNCQVLESGIRWWGFFDVK